MFNDWGEQKRREMVEIWQAHFSDHLSGFELFTSPLRENASAVIIGYNAGDGQRHATELDKHMYRLVADEPDFGLPKQGHYEEGGYEYPIAKKIRRCFFRGKLHLLPNAVETNRYFLRTEGKQHHRDVLDEVNEQARTIYEEFCRETNREVILRSNPRVIFDFSGEYTASEFCEDLGFDHQPTETYQHTNEKGFQAEVHLAEIIEDPDSTVISIKPHSSAPILAKEHLEFFANVIPPCLPDTT
jgi:hypothetical protein